MLAYGAVNQRTKVSQGDIIHRPSSGELDKPRWGFIVTADCDIVKDKSGSRLSYLDIVTVHHYLEHIWSAEFLRKLKIRTLKDAAALVTSASQSINDNFNIISPDDLLLWLCEETSEEIVSYLKISANKKKKYRDTLGIVELIFDLRSTNMTALQRLRQIWNIHGTSEKEVRARLEQALDYNKSTDFHIIPDVPQFDALGYVVLLREISSIHHDDLHASALELQISGRDNGFYVCCRSSDNLRYAISQKMAFMFSRIGMTEDYESQCDVVTQLALDELSSLHNFTRTSQ